VAEQCNPILCRIDPRKVQQEYDMLRVFPVSGIAVCLHLYVGWRHCDWQHDVAAFNATESFKSWPTFKI